MRVVVDSEKTLAEVRKMIAYPKLERGLTALHASPAQIMAYLMNVIVHVSAPKLIPGVIEARPFDDIFLGLADAGQARLIIWGDRHLLDPAE